MKMMPPDVISHENQLQHLFEPSILMLDVFRTADHAGQIFIPHRLCSTRAGIHRLFHFDFYISVLCHWISFVFLLYDSRICTHSIDLSLDDGEAWDWLWYPMLRSQRRRVSRQKVHDKRFNDKMFTEKRFTKKGSPTKGSQRQY